MYSNKDITLSLHKQCFGGAAQDFVIRFKKVETSIEDIITMSSSAVTELFERYRMRGKIIKGRLVARVMYTSMNSKESVLYYHPSFRSELIEDGERFYTDHMLKIAQRMDSFNRNGSSLVINNIE